MPSEPAVAIFRGYTQAALDAQYNNRARVPEHPAFLEAYARDSAAARAALRHEVLTYGPHPSQRLTLFPPAVQDAPVVAFIHGGYWQALSREHFDFLAPAFVQAGLGFVSVGYPLCPEVRFDALVDSLRQALITLEDVAPAHGLDARRIVLTGHSAGGHLTAALLSMDWARSGRSGPCGGCAVSGLFELEPIRLSYLNRALGLDEETARRHSPTRNVPSGAPPLVVAVGSAESEEFLCQQADFVSAWQVRGNPVQVVELPGFHHFDAVRELGRVGSPLFEAVIALSR
jgi:arylformamidase